MCVCGGGGGGVSGFSECVCGGVSGFSECGCGCGCEWF